MVEAAILLFTLPVNMPDAVPVEFAQPESLKHFGNTWWELVDPDNPDSPPVEVWESQVGPWFEPWCDKPLCALVPPRADGKREARYLLRTSERADRAFAYEDVDNARLFVSEGNQTVLAYNYGMMLADGVPEDRRRSCYVHPLLGLDGEQISGDFERDHYHHRGVLWAWPHMTVGDREVSLWDLRGIQARFEK